MGTGNIQGSIYSSIPTEAISAKPTLTSFTLWSSHTIGSMIWPTCAFCWMGYTSRWFHISLNRLETYPNPTPVWGQETAVHLYQQHPATTRTCTTDCRFTSQTRLPAEVGSLKGSNSSPTTFGHSSFTCLLVHTGVEQLCRLGDSTRSTMHFLWGKVIIISADSWFSSMQPTLPQPRNIRESKPCFDHALVGEGMNLDGDTTIWTSISSIRPWSTMFKKTINKRYIT